MSDYRITRLKGEFCVTWGYGKDRRRYRLGTADPKQAAAKAAARYAELTRPTGTTVKALWDGYCHDHAGRSVVRTMGYTWKAMAERFGALEAQEVTIGHCRSHTAERQAAGISNGTIHTELGHLRMVCLWAVRHSLLARAPSIERPSKPEPKDAHLTRQEVGRLIAEATLPHLRLAIILMIGTAARNEAVMQLTWDRVDFGRGRIQLRNPFDKARRKGRATIPMNDTLRAALSAAKRYALTPFVVEWGNQWDDDAKRWVPVKSIRKALKAAGARIGRPDVSPHMLRHTAAVLLVEDGHSMDEVAQFLGHSNTSITFKVYGRFSPTHLRKLAKTLEI